MSNTDVDKLMAHIEQLPDRDVIQALASPNDYTVEAMVIYESEAKRRGIQSEAVRPIALQESQRKKDKVATAWSFKGIGEKLYGMRSFRADGSYQVTKWFVFLHLPIYPISSLRIKCDDKGEISVIDLLPIDRRQVVDTYCFVIVSWAAIVIAIRLINQHSIANSEIITLGLLGLPYLFLYIVRRRAQKRLDQNER